MSPAGDWLEQLEARLEQQLEAFLQANPGQEALLQEQERLEHQQRQQQRLIEAQALRSELLQLASEIRDWRDRAQRARSAGASDLAARADRHVAQLMERGRQRWQALAQLGQDVRSGAAQTSASRQAAAKCTPQPQPLDDAWARFELEQELEAMRQRRAGSAGL